MIFNKGAYFTFKSNLPSGPPFI